MRNVWQTEEFIWKSCEWKGQPTKLTIYHKCMLTEFEDICASGFRSREFQLNALCKGRRNGKLKGQAPSVNVTYITLPGSQPSMSFCENKNQKNAVTKHQYLKTWKILPGLGFDKH